MLMIRLHISVESLKVECKQDSENVLAMQVRETIQQVLGQSRGKQETKMPNTRMLTLNTSMPTSYRSPSAATVRMGNPGRDANPNLQQPFYQTNSYGHVPQTHPDGLSPLPPTILSHGQCVSGKV
jgi:hypothetical protein